MFRFSLAALLGLVSFAALGCAALANATDLWRESMVTLMLGLLLTATLAAIIWRGERRALATGFAVFGWVYVLLVMIPAVNVRDDLLTEEALTWLYEFAHGADEQGGSVLQTVVFTDGAAGGEMIVSGSGRIRSWNAMKGGAPAVSFQSFADIGHSLWAIVIACLGAVVASLLSSGQRRRVARAAGG
ncbi:MAG: hypothetical protein KY475_14325 [Planctomycetes bacterium]|nr:hypothetical protein [Planctomycetota bacterium]